MREHENRSRHDAPETLNLIELKKKDINSLIKIAREYNIENANSMRVQDLIFALLQAQTKQNGVIYGSGVLETLPDGFGFLRAPDYNYLPGPDDIYVSPSQIRRFNMRTGIQSLGIYGRPRKVSAITPCLRLKRSISVHLIKPLKKYFSTT